jgi:hypothetical protein
MQPNYSYADLLKTTRFYHHVVYEMEIKAFATQYWLPLQVDADGTC